MSTEDQTNPGIQPLPEKFTGSSSEIPVEPITGLPQQLADELGIINGFSGQIEEYLDNTYGDFFDPVFRQKLIEFGKGINDLSDKIFGPHGGWVEYCMNYPVTKT